MSESECPRDSPLVRTWLLPLAGGVAAGFVAGLFGVGGGVVLVPLLVLVLGRSQPVAHATSLVAIVVPAVAGAARFSLDGAVAWGGAAAVAGGALAGVQLGAAALPRISERWLRLLFAALLAVMAVRLLLAGAPATGQVGGARPNLTPALLALHVALGLVAGAASALLGIGGGAIIVPVLVLTCGYGQHLAEGTSLATIAPTALVGGLAHTRRSYTRWGLGLRLGAGGLAGSLMGAQLALSLPASTLSRIFAGLLVVVTILLLRRSRRDRLPTDALAPG